MANKVGKVSLLKQGESVYLRSAKTACRVDTGSMLIHSLRADAQMLMKYGCVGGYDELAFDALPSSVEEIASVSFNTKGESEITYKSSLPHGLKTYITGN